MKYNSKFEQEEELSAANLTQNSDVSLSKNVRILKTNLWCVGCETNVRKYIDKTPDEFLGKYLCNCVDNNNEATSPVFPLFHHKVKKNPQIQNHGGRINAGSN